MCPQEQDQPYLPTAVTRWTTCPLWSPCLPLTDPVYTPAPPKGGPQIAVPGHTYLLCDFRAVTWLP